MSPPEKKGREWESTGIRAGSDPGLLIVGRNEAFFRGQKQHNVISNHPRSTSIFDLGGSIHFFHELSSSSIIKIDPGSRTIFGRKWDKKIDFETHFPRKLERSEQYIAKVFGRRAEKSFNYAGGAG